jgi:ferritin
MEIKQKMEKAFNDQINKELFSAYLYVSMSGYFESKNLSGFAHWMRLQAKEEYDHAMRIYKYLCERKGRVELHEIAIPKKEWESPQSAFEEAYAHEKTITESINKLVDIANSENDKASFNMLQWFVNEQVEEEAQTDLIAAQLKMIGDSTNGLFMLNKELSKRE